VENNIKFRAEQQQFRAMPWFLAHGVLNSIFALWTFGGSVFLLFLNELGLPKGQIGAVLALFPFCGMLALGFAPVATRWGWKRVFLACYGTRKVVMALLLLLPWVLTTAGQTAGLIFLFGVIIVFALLRALAETAFYPWSQEFIPNRVRGKIAGISTMLGMLASGVALGIAGWVIGHGTGLPRFLALIAAGCVLGLLGVMLMGKVPGGAPRPDPVAAGVHGANMVQALRDRNFVAWLGGSGCVTVGTLLFTSFLPLFIKERLGIASGTVVVLDIVVMAGGALAGLLLGWAADRVGSRPVLMPAAAMTLLVPLGWLLLPRQTPHAVAWCAALYFLNGVAAGGVAIAAGRLLFNSVIPPDQSTAYTAIYYAWMGITGGLAPLLAGALLTTCGDWQTRVGVVLVDGHGLLFLGAFLLLAAGWWLYGRVRPDDRHTTRTVLKQLLEPALQSRLLQIWR
jgi:MFS family permease